MRPPSLLPSVARSLARSVRTHLRLRFRRHRGPGSRMGLVCEVAVVMALAAKHSDDDERVLMLLFCDNFRDTRGNELGLPELFEVNNSHRRRHTNTTGARASGRAGERASEVGERRRTRIAASNRAIDSSTRLFVVREKGSKHESQLTSEPCLPCWG